MKKLLSILLVAILTLSLCGAAMADEPIEPVGDGIVRAAGFNIYPWPWLCPMNYFTGELNLQPQSHAIHHYAASWVDDIDRQTLLQKFGRRLRAAAVRLRSL